MTKLDNTNLLLKKAFEKKQNMARKMQEINSEFNQVYGDSKYQDIEIPDSLIDSIDYGTGPLITFDEFIKVMDEKLKEEKTE